MARRSAGKAGSDTRPERPAPRPRRPGSDTRPERPAPKGWGSVARRGAGSLRRPAEETPDRARPAPARVERPAWHPERWEEERPRSPARPAPGAQGPGQARVPRAVVKELGQEAGAVAGGRLARRLAEAARAYDRDRYADALRLLRSLAAQAPGSPAVGELLGLTLYRMGRWREAVRVLSAVAERSGSYDQHPVLADCHRALGHWARVDELWLALREASPSAEVVAEGRIVAAGALADQGRLAEAIALLEGSASVGRRPRLHHLRLSYQLADLYERVGETARARHLFEAIAARDPAFADVVERRGALG